MDFHLAFGITAGLIQIIAAIPYIWSMLRGTTRPNIITQILWTALQTIALLAQISAGASWSVIILVVLTVNTAIVTLISFFGYGYKKYRALDFFCFALAILAIVLWQITNEPLLALMLSIFADALASFPTIMKTYKDPRSEPVFPWAITMLASLLAVLSSEKLDFANLAFPVYMIFIDGSITYFAFFGRRKLPLRQSDVQVVKD